MTTNPPTACRTCVTPINFIDCPTGGWWAHDTHPADGHDAVPGAWVDGDSLMEAIAAAVWEHCRTEGTSLVVDDPRNVAGTAAAVARRLLAAVAAPPSATRADDWRAAAVFVEAMNEACDNKRPCESCTTREDVAAELRRVADEAGGPRRAGSDEQPQTPEAQQDGAQQ